MKTSFYSPVLKSKQGEFDALSKLNAKEKEMVCPLLEITPREWDSAFLEKPKTMEAHLENFCKKFTKKWARNNAFIDTGLIAKDSAGGKSCNYYVFNLLSKSNFTPIPVAHLSFSDELLGEIGMMGLLFGVDEFALRLSVSDLMKPDLESVIERALDKIGEAPNKFHIVFDLHDSNFQNADDFSDAIVEILADFPMLKGWKSITVCGGAFPATNLIKQGVNEIPRNEWKFYNLLIKKAKLRNIKRPINYGDYGIVAPGYFEFDPLKMSRSANIRYTHNDIWFVVKGKALKKSEDYEQYIEQAVKITKSRYYLGAGFSHGDTHLKQCALGKTTTGNSTTWNTVGHNHHFSKVIADLFASSPAA